MESGNFWNDEGIRPDDWYVYYCNIAEHLSKQGYIVFVSSHEVVRNRLRGSNEIVLSIVPSLDLNYEWRMKLKERWENSQLEKDYKAWMNAEDRYEENIQEIIDSGFPCYQIESMDYKLEDILKSFNAFHKNI